MVATVIVVAVLGIAVLLALAVWANRRYRRFERLPVHFDFRGKADAFGPRKVILWVVPTILMTTLAAIAAIMVLVPRELQNGNPVTGIVVATIALIVAQALIVWLLDRWAATRGPG